MIKELPNRTVPNWLQPILEGEDTRFPALADLLENSLYYPSAGLNGTPVKFLGGNVHSFVYADYGISERQYLDNLHGRGRNCGFKGFHCVYETRLGREDIVPPGWTPPLNPPDRERVARAQSGCEPFGHWSVWRRNADNEDASNPEGFSFLYFAGEMSAIYQGLYGRLGIAPEILAIIQPGGLGGEWETMQMDNSFFKSVVRSNKAGMPRYLLCGGEGGPDHYKMPDWFDYRGECLARLPERHAGLWGLRETPI